jgi:hypothetical protein
MWYQVQSCKTDCKWLFTQMLWWVTPQPVLVVPLVLVLFETISSF